MVKRLRVGTNRWWHEAVDAEEKHFSGVIGREGRLREYAIVESLERVLRSVGFRDLRIEVTVSPKKAGRDRGLEVRISGPCRTAALRAIRQDLKRLKQAK